MANYYDKLVTEEGLAAALQGVSNILIPKEKFLIGSHFMANIDSSGGIWFNCPLLAYYQEVLGKAITLEATGDIRFYWEGRSTASPTHPNDNYQYPITSVSLRPGGDVRLTANFGSVNWTWYQVGVYVLNGLYATIK